MDDTDSQFPNPEAVLLLFVFNNVRLQVPKALEGSNEKVRQLKGYISRPPLTITYITLESWKVIIILIVRKGILIWIK